MIKGINQNFSPEGIPEGFAFFTKNQVINEKLNEVFNEKGTKVIETFIGSGVDTINGVITFGGKVIVFYKGMANVGQVIFNQSFTDYKVTPNVNGPRGELGVPFVTSSLGASLTIPSDKVWQSNMLYDFVPFTPGATINLTLDIDLGTYTGDYVLRCSFLNNINSGIGEHLIDVITPLPNNPTTGALRFRHTKTLVVPSTAAQLGFSMYNVGGDNTNGTITIFQTTVQSDGIPGIMDNIGVYDEETEVFITKVSRTDFGFDANFPISGRAKLNSIGELVVAFTDNNVSPKYVNLDTALISDNIKLYNLTLIGPSPDITPTLIESAGSFKTGAYFVSIQLRDRNKAGSSWSALSKPIYVVNHNLTDAYYKTQGSDSGVNSTKAIRIVLDNLDMSFKTVRIALISKIAGVTSAKIYKEITIKNVTQTVTLTGGELTDDVAVEDILSHNQIYTKVVELESLADQLFLADVETTPVIDFQKLVNRIVVKWKSTPIYDIVKDNSKPYKEDGNKKTFLHGEVYALYAQIELPNGQLTDWFHIPGQPFTTGKSSSTIANSVKIGGVTPKKYQIEDIFPTGAAPAQTGTITSPGGGYLYGEMCAWENDNEVYPDSFPDFAGQKVRHHKFPATTFFRSYYPSSYMVSMWDTLGLQVSLPNFPSEFSGTFRSIRFGYAKRDISNCSVLGYDIIQFAGYNSYVPGYTGLGGNWQIAADGGNNDFVVPDKKLLRLHSPDLFILRPSVSDLYLHRLIQLRLDSLNGSYATGDGGRFFTGSNTSSSSLDLDTYTYISDFTKANIAILSSSDYFLKLSEAKFVASNSIAETPSIHINNLLNEECLHAKAERDLTIAVSGDGTGGANFLVHLAENRDSPGLIEYTNLVVIKAPKSDFFVNYTDQQVIPIGGIVRNLEGNGISVLDGDGDGFICLYSFMTAASAPANDAPYNFTDNDGIRCFKMFLCESRFNLNQRYQIDGDPSTYFYPLSSWNAPASDRDFQASWLNKLNQTSLNINTIKYSKDFNSENDLEQYGVYNHDSIYTSKIPFAIARSLKSRRDNDLDDGWRQFKPNDIFYTIRDKGRIINLQAWGTDSLLIHHEQALLKTRDKAVLQTDITTINLGSGDLFTLEPQEVAATKDGYGGTQHKFSCHLNQAGYCFIDAQTGEVFIHKGDQSYMDISKGFRLFFREVFRNNTFKDNPFNSSGVVMAFDKENYRLILSLKADSGIAFTASFDLIKEEWVGLHDYKPDFIFNTRKNLYSFKDTILYQHNKGKRGEYYGIVYPSFTDVVINIEPTREKILNAVQWFSRVEKDGSIKADETITSITIWNDYFCTGKIDVSPRTNLSEYETKNARQVDRAWNFDQIFDIVKFPSEQFIDDVNGDYRPIITNLDGSLAWFEKEPVRGKYFIIRLEYSNIEDKLVSLRGIVPELKFSAQ